VTSPGPNVSVEFGSHSMSQGRHVRVTGPCPPLEGSAPDADVRVVFHPSTPPTDPCTPTVDATAATLLGSAFGRPLAWIKDGDRLLLARTDVEIVLHPVPVRASGPTVTDDRLAGRNYATDRLVVDGTEREIAFAQPSFTFTATPDGLQLIAGACLRGTMRVVDGRLTGSVARNPRGCAADFYQLDDSLMAMLNASPSISLDGSSLVIDSGTARVEASQYEPTGVMPLGFLDTAWRYSSEELPSVAQAGSPPTLQISVEGTWLFGPCGGQGGKVVGRVDGTVTLRIGDFAPLLVPAGGCVTSGADADLAARIHSIGATFDGGSAVATRVDDTLIVTTATRRLEFTLVVPGTG
jgi:hypothetical protein